jgi:hypothetical protein
VEWTPVLRQQKWGLSPPPIMSDDERAGHIKAINGEGNRGETGTRRSNPRSYR